MLAKARINPMLSVHFIGSMKRSHSDTKLQSKPSTNTSGKGEGTSPSIDAASSARSAMGIADGDDTTSTTSATEADAKGSHRTCGRASTLGGAEGDDEAQPTFVAAKVDQSTTVVRAAENMRSRKNKSSGKRAAAATKSGVGDTDQKASGSRRSGNSGKRQRSDGTARTAAAAVALPKHSSSEADENEVEEYSLTTAHGQLRHNSALTYTEAVVAAKAEYNRRNAARARQRAKTRLVELQQEVHHLSQHVQSLKTTNETLQATLRALKEQSAQLVRNQKAIDNGTASTSVAAAGAAGFGTSAVAASAAVHPEPQLPQQAPQQPPVPPIVPIGNPADLLLQFFLASALQAVPQPPPSIVPTQPSPATSTVPMLPPWLLNAPTVPTPAAATFLPPPQMDPSSLNVQWLSSHPAAIGNESATTTNVLPLSQETAAPNNNPSHTANDDRDGKPIDEAPDS